MPTYLQILPGVCTSLQQKLDKMRECYTAQVFNPAVNISEVFHLLPLHTFRLEFIQEPFATEERSVIVITVDYSS